MFRKKKVLILILMLLIGAWGFWYGNQELNASLMEEKGLIRLHVIAHSDSVHDQKTKLLVTGILVAGLGIYHGFSLLMIIIRGIGSFLLIYLLGWVLILLWEKISSPSDAPGKKNPGKESSFDFLVGDDLTDGTSPSENNKQTINDNKPAGQINMETISQMADEKAQAEILEKMVQGETR